ncbi:protein CPR-5 [Striga asiatica]|uniref:Protein CPR-5 n=1 Tax=Striga asiatica TaxID=4170 RepID=A0A5A7QT29_STRAF|nr:protein CPR-5 [Striga asiatica]
MDASLHHHSHRSTSPDGIAAVNPTEEITPDPSISGAVEEPLSKAAITRRKNRKKQRFDSDTVSSASSNCCGYAMSSSQKGIRILTNPKKIRVGPLMTARRRVGPSDVDALGLPLGMSIAAVVAQVLDRKNAAGDNLSLDYLSEICILAVRESLGNVFGEKFDNFLENFEKSFRSTLMTLRLISDTPQNIHEQAQRARFVRCSCSCSLDKLKNPICFHEAKDNLKSLSSGEQHQQVLGRHTSLDQVQDSLHPLSQSQSQTPPQMEKITSTNSMSRELVLHDKNNERQLAHSNTDQFSMLSTIEKSIIEQTRSNDLKAFEIGLIMKKLQLKEKQLELNSSANILERWKFSMGLSKATFKAEKFKTQLQDMRQVELLKKCLDFLVAGLVIMLFSLGYGTYAYSHRRIIEATEACSPHTESKSWWMPKSMATFNTGLHLLKCQIQVLSRMLFGILMIGAIAFLLIQRSSASHHTMPVTFILLLLGVMCGYAGKFCVDTLGGSGSHWLIYWEALCLLHFLSNVFSPYLYVILNGPITVVERAEGKCSVLLPYWVRRVIFFALLIILPLFCGLMPFAGPREWFEHFRSGALGFLTVVDD